MHTVSDEQKQRVLSRLAEFQSAARHSEAAANDKLAQIRASRALDQTDDEHDPDGPTLAFEWSMATYALQEARNDLASAEAALGRLADGTYGICERCHTPIAPARLAARPTGTTCIECAGL